MSDTGQPVIRTALEDRRDRQFHNLPCARINMSNFVSEIFGKVNLAIGRHRQSGRLAISCRNCKLRDLSTERIKTANLVADPLGKPKLAVRRKPQKKRPAVLSGHIKITHSTRDRIQPPDLVTA